MLNHSKEEKIPTYQAANDLAMRRIQELGRVTRCMSVQAQQIRDLIANTVQNMIEITFFAHISPEV